jgi:hypothetical protein
MDPNNAINGLTEKITDGLVQVRRTIHQNPEVGFEELETAKLVSSILDRLGILQRTGGTGVVGVLAIPDGHNHRRIAQIPIDPVRPPRFRALALLGRLPTASLASPAPCQASEKPA